jgi:N-hydroxyarylamine O-acetyltransferase
MPDASAPLAADEWATGQLDLVAYLRRIGHIGQLAPTAQTLAALHRAHVAAIPFENADIILGRISAWSDASRGDDVVRADTGRQACSA